VLNKENLLELERKLNEICYELRSKAELNRTVGLFMLESKFRSNAITIEAAQRNKDLTNFLERNALKVRECLKLL